MTYSDYDKPDYFGVALFIALVLFLVGTFGGMAYSVHVDEKLAQQCISAGNEWVESNCLKP